jgi:signal transduction histidine kinase
MVVVLFAGDRSTLPLRVVLAFIAGVCVLWACGQPWFALPAAVVTETLLVAVPPHTPWIPLASIAAIYLATSSTRFRVGVGWLVGVVVGMWLTAASFIWVTPDSIELTHLVVFDYVVIAVAVGTMVRTRAERIDAVRAQAVATAASREREADQRVQAERMRIARDLHDDVAHHITLVNAQAGVARYLMATPHSESETKVAETLTAIEEASRLALDELRSTVGLLTSAPDVNRLPVAHFDARAELIESFRSAGMTIEHTEYGMGEPVDGGPMTGSVARTPGSVAAYRVLAEALQNARKHGTAASATVRIRMVRGIIDIEVINPARPAVQGEGTRLGLTGLRDTVVASGGSIDAGYRDDQFVIHARLPIIASDREMRNSRVVS